MDRKRKSVLYWAPRVLGLLFAGFLSLFALDVFGEGYGPGELVVALLMHLVPTIIVVLAIIFAWRREWIGGILFLGLGVFYIVMAWGKFPLVTYFVISGPLFLIGALFWVNWAKRRTGQI